MADPVRDNIRGKTGFLKLLRNAEGIDDESIATDLRVEVENENQYRNG
jgi:hypothetical protein